MLFGMRQVRDERMIVLGEGVGMLLLRLPVEVDLVLLPGRHAGAQDAVFVRDDGTAHRSARVGIVDAHALVREQRHRRVQLHLEEKVPVRSGSFQALDHQRIAVADPELDPVLDLGQLDDSPARSRRSSPPPLCRAGLQHVRRRPHNAQVLAGP